MGHDWLLIETLATEPFVVAQGHSLRKFVRLPTFFRRNPFLPDIVAAVDNAVRTASANVHTTSRGQRLIRTEPVLMSDGRVHGVQVWSGSATDTQPIRPPIGAVVWDLTDGVATDTRQALINSGMDPATEPTHDRSFADDLSISDFHPHEGKTLALTVNCVPGQTLCSTWDVKDRDGQPIRVNFTARAALEPWPGGPDHLVARAMNWRSPYQLDGDTERHLAKQIVQGMAQEGVHRAIVDLKNWALLKWLDPPCPYFDWRGIESRRPLVHPDDKNKLDAMTKQFVDGPAQGVLRLRNHKNSWALLHVTVYRIELEENAYAGLISARLPTPSELLDVRAEHRCN